MNKKGLMALSTTLILSMMGTYMSTAYAAEDDSNAKGYVSDINSDGKISILDVCALQRGTEYGFEDESEFNRADVNKDSYVDANDENLLLRYMVGITDNIEVASDEQESEEPEEVVEVTPTEQPQEESQASAQNIEDEQEESKEMLSYLKPYYEQNNDLIGWLKIEDTPIDDPVMFTPDDEQYYLEKDFNKEYLNAGSFFISGNSVIEEDDSNTIIYGHNMKDMSMFGSLKLYRDESYYKNNKYITFDTLYEEGTYEVYAAFYAQILTKSDTSFKYYKYTTKFDDTYTMDSFVAGIDSMKLYTTDCSKPQKGDRLLTLSTCSSHTENGRFVVVAKKID